MHMKSEYPVPCDVSLIIDIPLFFYICPPPLLRTTVIVHNRFPQENINVYESCKNQHAPLIMCGDHSNDEIIDFFVHEHRKNRGKIMRNLNFCVLE